MIEINHISKRFGTKQALNDVTFTAADGRVTGFLGPNGSGKSTTMKTALGQLRPDSGTALIDGELYAHHAHPMECVGAVLDAKSAHRGRKAIAHLRAMAASNGIPDARVNEVIELTGLQSVAQRKAGTFSLGMNQRLSIAAALLGDPRNLILDEPVNGLDPEGVKWVRDLCRMCAAQGKAVLLSSHLMSEVAQTADDLVIIGQGRILETSTVSQFINRHSYNRLYVVTPTPDAVFAMFATSPDVVVERVALQSPAPADAAALTITGADLVAVARLFAQSQLVTYTFTEQRGSLEDAYMQLTHASAEYVAQPYAAAGQPSFTPSSPVQGAAR
ncbi:ABC transporter ATP-binding protein [Bifidobacterium gallicum]|uniref:ABC transporter, ATP-binding protein n=1 Tax=Bifidobacterium gallicum DSM 20093 = LMG 11596 TaxID=561180 RepID=D1NWY6_9BIFI|nr:ATP-binding cassette domain-containing protein [Bifidobacterium gallicum]EFA22117.1 ABC transporter, ATP-binding protein [Bifidobacterium gallicum DSM 20093 = LMG 11596]KFI59020.1 multidrug ABC transporter ATP-binding protein [Bifidobacterium gallicum DSM 20093 = LMG 11596]